MSSGSSYNVKTPHYISDESSVSDKLEQTFDVLEDIITTFKSQGCPGCLQLLREIVKKYSDPLLSMADNKSDENHYVNI